MHADLDVLLQEELPTGTNSNLSCNRRSCNNHSVITTCFCKMEWQRIVFLNSTSCPSCMQIWVGSKQRELQANSSQLLQAYTPHAVWLLAILIPVCEPIGECVPMNYV